MEISIIVTAHHEGLTSHKTMLSVLKAAEALDRNSISYEIIVSMDNPDETTRNYYARYQDDLRFRVMSVNYGNVSESRNNAVRLSKGKYVALLDGDDMITPNWYVDSYKLAEKKAGLFVLHPEVQVQFGMNEWNNVVWLMSNSLEKELDAEIMVQYNRWVSALFAPRGVFDKVHYVPPVKGYGYEDYQFNAETIASGIKHYITPRTVFFYRRMAESKQTEHISEHTLLPYTELFDFDYAKTWPIKSISDTASKKSFASLVDKAVTKAKGTKLANSYVKRHGEFVRNYLAKKKLKALPDWLIQEWKDINKIDNELWPTTGAIAKIEFHPRSFDQSGPSATRAGRIYGQLARQFSAKPDYIFFTYDPLGAGGTEKVMVNYINSLKKAHPDWHIAVMRKKPAEFPFNVPDDVDFIDFDGVTKGIHPWEKSVVFDRLIVQSQCRRLHCFFNGWADSDYTYGWVRDHRKFLVQNGYRVYVSWFMREFVSGDEAGRVMTFADPYMGAIHDVIDKVFTDNSTVIDEALENNAFDRNKFVVHHQPMTVNQFTKPHDIDKKCPLRVLWASRLSYQKRPDIVRAIAQLLDEDGAGDIKIDAYGREQNFKGSYFDGLSSIEYKGYFNGFNSLPLDNYDVFLYTSQVDGMPNVLLEATCAGLPIVASDDGGVSELVKNNVTGKLVEIEDIEGYVAALRDVHNSPSNAKKYVVAAQKEVKEHYTQAEFDAAVKRDIT